MVHKFLCCEVKWCDRPRKNLLPSCGCRYPPPPLIQNYPTEEIDMYFFFVSSNKLFYTKTKAIKIQSSSITIWSKKKETTTALHKIKAAIEQRGFKIIALNGDN